MYVCGSLCAHSHRRVVHMHVRWAHSSWQGPCACEGASRAHSHSCEHSHAQAGGCAPDLAPNMLAMVFFAWERDLHLVWLHLCILESQSWKHPEKDVCTEHGILSCSSALNMTFLFLFFCFCLTVRDASFLAWQLCRKIIIPHFVLRTNCAERFYRVLEVEREGGCGGSTIKTGSTEYR